MLLQNNGAISFSQLRAEFKQNLQPISMSDLYLNNVNKYTIAVDGIPSTCSSISISKFYNKAKVKNYSNLVLFLDTKNQSSYSGSGTTWIDLSSKANNLVISNGSYGNTAGGVINFDGTSTFTRIATFNGFTSGNWTAIFWIYATGNFLNGAQLIGGVMFQLGRNSTDPDTEVVMYINGMWDYQGGYGFNVVKPTTNINSTAWYQLALIKNGTTCYWYLNGAANGTNTASKNAAYSSNDFCIGKDYRDNNSFFQGGIAIVMIYNYSMTATEISDNFTNYRNRYGL